MSNSAWTVLKNDMKYIKEIDAETQKRSYGPQCFVHGKAILLVVNRKEVKEQRIGWESDNTEN